MEKDVEVSCHSCARAVTIPTDYWSRKCAGDGSGKKCRALNLRPLCPGYRYVRIRCSFAGYVYGRQPETSRHIQCSACDVRYKITNVMTCVLNGQPVYDCVVAEDFRRQSTTDFNSIMETQEVVKQFSELVLHQEKELEQLRKEKSLPEKQIEEQGVKRAEKSASVDYAALAALKDDELEQSKKENSFLKKQIEKQQTMLNRADEEKKKSDANYAALALQQETELNQLKEQNSLLKKQVEEGRAQIGKDRQKTVNYKKDLAEAMKEEVSKLQKQAVELERLGEEKKALEKTTKELKGLLAEATRITEEYEEIAKEALNRLEKEEGTKQLRREEEDGSENYTQLEREASELRKAVEEEKRQKEVESGKIRRLTSILEKMIADGFSLPAQNTSAEVSSRPQTVTVAAGMRSVGGTGTEKSQEASSHCSLFTRSFESRVDRRASSLVATAPVSTSSKHQSPLGSVQDCIQNLQERFHQKKEKMAKVMQAAEKLTGGGESSEV